MISYIQWNTSTGQINHIQFKKYSFPKEISVWFDHNSLLQMSLALAAAFGRDSEGGAWTVRFLVDKVRSNLSVWSAEVTVVEDTVQLLGALVDKRER